MSAFTLHFFWFGGTLQFTIEHILYRIHIISNNPTIICTWSWFFMTFTTCKQSTLVCAIEHLIFEFSDLKLWRCRGCTCAAYATFSLTHGNSTHALNKNCCVEYMRCWRNCIPRFMSPVVTSKPRVFSWSRTFQTVRCTAIMIIYDEHSTCDSNLFEFREFRTQHHVLHETRTELWNTGMPRLGPWRQSQLPKEGWVWLKDETCFFGTFLRRESWQGIYSAWFSQNLLFLNNSCFLVLLLFGCFSFVGCGDVFFPGPLCASQQRKMRGWATNRPCHRWRNVSFERLMSSTWPVLLFLP